jgi:NitT/TauT family transport system substrate-binding protein
MTTPHRRRLRWFATVVALIALAATACGQGGGSSGGASGRPTVSFATSQNPSSIGLLVALIKKRHLDADNGIELVPKTYSPSDAESALLTGQVDAGFFGYISWARSPDKVRKLTFLRPLQAEHGSLLVKADSPYQSMADLKGKKLVSLGPVSANYTDFQLLAAKVGMDWKKDFNVVAAPPPGLVAFLQKGEVQGSVVYEPTVSRLLSSGKYRSVLSANDQWQKLVGSPLNMLGVAASQRWVKDHKDTARRLAKTVAQALQILATDRAVYTEFAGILGVHSAKEIALTASRMSPIYVTGSASKEEAGIHDQLKLAKDLGIIPEVPDRVFSTAAGSG